MNKNFVVTLILIILALLAVVFFINRSGPETPNPETPPNNNGQTEGVFLNTIVNASLDYSFSYPDNFIELTDEQSGDLSNLGYIPPCVENYDSCIYHTGDELENTNFDSSGLSVHRITDTDLEACTTFAGANLLPNSEISTEEIGGSTFYIAPSGEAGAGHVAEEVLYRTHHDNTCFEVLARVGYTQFGNYPEGSIEEFTDADRNDLMNTMRSIVETFSFEG